MAFLATDFLSRGRLGPEASGLLGFGVGRKCPSASALSTLWVWVSSGRKRSLGAYPLPPPHSHLLTEPNAQGGEGRTQEGGPRVCVTRSPEPRRAEAWEEGRGTHVSSVGGRPSGPAALNGAHPEARARGPRKHRAVYPGSEPGAGAQKASGLEAEGIAAAQAFQRPSSPSASQGDPSLPPRCAPPTAPPLARSRRVRNRQTVVARASLSQGLWRQDGRFECVSPRR